MTLQVDYLAFAIGASPNVIDQPTWVASQSGSGIVADGFQAGIAQSNYFNKGFRQSSMVSAAVANFIANTLNVNVIDDGNLPNLITLLEEAIQAIATQGGTARIVTASTNLTLAATDYSVGFNRTSGVASFNIQLPPAPTIGQKFKLSDLSENCGPGQFPMTVLPPAGHTFMSRNTWVMNVAGQVFKPEYMGSNIWTFEVSNP